MSKRSLTIGLPIILLAGILLAFYFYSPAPQNPEPAELVPRFATADLMSQPIPLQRRETTAELLPVWRKYRDTQPTLLLLSNNPHLVEAPAILAAESKALLDDGIAEQITQRSDRQQSNPLFRSESAVDIALRSGWFTQLAWALPIRNPAQELNLEKFRRQLLAGKAATEAEAQSITLDDRYFSGQLRGQKMTAAALPRLHNLNGPVVVHIDLSYFQPLYKNELGTPLLDVVFETLNTLKKMHLKTLAVTFSYGHLDEQMALDVRYLGDVLAYLIEDPVRLHHQVPQVWQLQGEALRQAHFSRAREVRDLYLAQEQVAPEAAWVQYNLYQSAAADNAPAALNHLARAVQLDPLYALEYLDLSEDARLKNSPDEALRLLTLAAEVFPGNVQIKLGVARLTAETGDKQGALQQVEELQGLDWSQAYYPEMSSKLEVFAEQLQKSPAATNQKSAE